MARLSTGDVERFVADEIASGLGIDPMFSAQTECACETSIRWMEVHRTGGFPVSKSLTTYASYTNANDANNPNTDCKLEYDPPTVWIAPVARLSQRRAGPSFRGVRGHRDHRHQCPADRPNGNPCSAERDRAPEGARRHGHEAPVRRAPVKGAAAAAARGATWTRDARPSCRPFLRSISGLVAHRVCAPPPPLASLAVRLGGEVVADADDAGGLAAALGPRDESARSP